MMSNHVVFSNYLDLELVRMHYTHDYTTISSSHEWGHIIRFKGVHNAVVDNVEMHEGSGDGFEVFGVSDRLADGSLKPGKWESFNITVKNCLINDNRRQNITIADGTNIFINITPLEMGAVEFLALLAQ